MATTTKSEGTDLPREATKAPPEDVTFHTTRRIGSSVVGGTRDRIWVLFFVAGIVSGVLTTVATQFAMPVAVPEPVAVISETDYEADVAALASNSRTARERIFRVVNSVEREINVAKEELETALLSEQEALAERSVPVKISKAGRL